MTDYAEPPSALRECWSRISGVGMGEKSVMDRTRVAINAVHVDPILEGVIEGNGECFPQKGRFTEMQEWVDESQWNPPSMYACDCV